MSLDEVVKRDLQAIGDEPWVVDRADRSPSLAKLGAALSKAQGEIAGAAKDKTNPHFKSAYADLASVWDACREPLSKHELAVIQAPSANGRSVTVETTLVHSSGEWISDSLTMTAQQDTPQAIGSCITYARRYALSAMVGVAPEDDDGNAASQRTNGHERAVATPHEDTPKVALPEGAARILAVEASGGKPWRCKLRDENGDYEAAIFSESVRDFAVQCAQDGTPVSPTINKQGQMTKLHRFARPLTPPVTEPLETISAKDIPF